MFQSTKQRTLHASQTGFRILLCPPVLIFARLVFELAPRCILALVNCSITREVNEGVIPTSKRMETQMASWGWLFDASTQDTHP